MPPPLTAPSRYLLGYPDELLAKVRTLIDGGRLGEWLASRYGERHEVRTDKALYDYVTDLKMRHLRQAETPSKVLYDAKLKVIQHALGTHTTVARVQGARLKAKHEIRVATLFKDTAPEFLRMIVVHELAHLKEKAHDKAFYQLCTHMEPAYHQYEFDLRLYLTHQDLLQAASRAAPPA